MSIVLNSFLNSYSYTHRLVYLSTQIREALFEVDGYKLWDPTAYLVELVVLAGHLQHNPVSQESLHKKEGGIRVWAHSSGHLQWNIYSTWQYR